MANMKKPPKSDDKKGKIEENGMKIEILLANYEKELKNASARVLAGRGMAVPASEEPPYIAFTTLSANEYEIEFGNSDILGERDTTKTGVVTLKVKDGGYSREDGKEYE